MAQITIAIGRHTTSVGNKRISYACVPATASALGVPISVFAASSLTPDRGDIHRVGPTVHIDLRPGFGDGQPGPATHSRHPDDDISVVVVRRSTNPLTVAAWILAVALIVTYSATWAITTGLSVRSSDHAHAHAHALVQQPSSSTDIEHPLPPPYRIAPTLPLLLALSSSWQHLVSNSSYVFWATNLNTNPDSPDEQTSIYCATGYIMFYLCSEMTDIFPSNYPNPDWFRPLPKPGTDDSAELSSSFISSMNQLEKQINIAMIPPSRELESLRRDLTEATTKLLGAMEDVCEAASLIPQDHRDDHRSGRGSSGVENLLASSLIRLAKVSRDTPLIKQMNVSEFGLEMDNPEVVLRRNADRVRNVVLPLLREFHSGVRAFAAGREAEVVVKVLPDGNTRSSFCFWKSTSATGQQQPWWQKLWGPVDEDLFEWNGPHWGRIQSQPRDRERRSWVMGPLTPFSRNPDDDDDAPLFGDLNRCVPKRQSAESFATHTRSLGSLIHLLQDDLLPELERIARCIEAIREASVALYDWYDVQYRHGERDEKGLLLAPLSSGSAHKGRRMRERQPDVDVVLELIRAMQKELSQAMDESWSTRKDIGSQPAK